MTNSVVGGESSSGSNTTPVNSTPKWINDVFLSFAGKDVRSSFISHLYEGFKREGIRCYKDDPDLEKGGVIEANLFKAIEDSLCAVVVISKNYAKSKWCLKELLKILEYYPHQDLKQRVLPVFFHVDPRDVRKQTESFEEAFDDHEKEFGENSTMVQNWRNALSQIGNLSGWHITTTVKSEADIVKEIVEYVWDYSRSILPSLQRNLVGIESRVDDMLSILEIVSNEIRFVGIWGMGGVGKTTLARVVFDKISYKFDICYFAEKGELRTLQTKPFFNRKVLLVLDDVDDDVDDISQLRDLVERQADLFGEGSRIIITTRNRRILTLAEVEEKRIYGMKTMEEDESLRLFSNKAFRKDNPEKDYLELSKSIVEYVGGLPLALDLLGNSLFRRSKAMWIDALERLKKSSSLEKKIREALKISYDGLQHDYEKTIFLDVACFFKGWKKSEVTQIFKSCDLNPIYGIEVLIEKALLVETIDCRLEMHDLLEDLAKYIVREESPNDVGERSRLWKFEDIKEVLEYDKGSKKIEAIVMGDYHQDMGGYHYRDKGKIKVDSKAFSNMSNLRLLFLDRRMEGPLSIPEGLNKVKCLLWPSFPFEDLPHHLNEVAHIDLQHSKIKQLCKGTQSMNHLKFINLSYSTKITEILDFSAAQSLEHLCLVGCKLLVKVHDSLGELKKLVEVDLWGCENLETLPNKLENDCLRRLCIRGCKKLDKLPDFGKSMKKLSYLDACETSITTLPESFGSLTGLRELNLSTTGLKNLPNGCFSSLFELIVLALHHCNGLKSLPRLPPRLLRFEATKSFGSGMDRDFLSGEQLWYLVSSLDHKLRGKTKYVISEKEEDDVPFSHGNYHNFSSSLLKLKDVELEYLPLRNFVAVMELWDTIPSWFYYQNTKICPDEDGECKCEIEVNVPQEFRCSEWSGIVVCMKVSGTGGWIVWSSKAPEDDDYTQCYACSHYIFLPEKNRDWLDYYHCIMVLELNEKTCWQHLRGGNNSLHLKFEMRANIYSFDDEGLSVHAYGWRVICEEEIQNWRNDNGFNQLFQPQPEEIKLPLRLLKMVIGQLDDYK